MAPVEKRLLAPSRRRSIPAEGFAWIDRRLVREGFLSGLSAPESLLYFFLALVGDRDGLSFWGDAKLASALKLTPASLEQARRGLERKDLILYRTPIYQVLSLPESPSHHDLRDATLALAPLPKPPTLPPSTTPPVLAPPTPAPAEPSPLPNSIARIIERAMNRTPRGADPR